MSTDNSRTASNKCCLLCGVGGQGTVLASRIIAEAAMLKGLNARTSETIGMAQRGGSVVSHVRTGETIPSPLITPGEADLILGFEPGEALRCLPFLKEGGTLICNNEVVQPVTATLGDNNYTSEGVIAELKKHVPGLTVINTSAIIKDCGTPKVLNTILLGAMAISGTMDLSPEDLEKALANKIKPHLLEINRKALALTAAALKEK